MSVYACVQASQCQEPLQTGHSRTFPSTCNSETVWILSNDGIINTDLLGSFVTWMSCGCALEGILEGQPHLGRFTSVPNTLHREIMTLIAIHWRPGAL